MQRKKKAFNWRPYIKNAARKAWLWSPVRWEAIKAAEVSPGVVKCAGCALIMKKNETPTPYRVDHIIPAAQPEVGNVTWDEWLRRLLDVAVTGLQVLCKGCNDVKTKKEATTRVRARALGRVQAKTKASKKCD